MGVEGQRKGMISARLSCQSPIVTPEVHNRDKAVFIHITMFMVAILGTSGVGLGDVLGGNCRVTVRIEMVLLKPSGATMLKG